MRATIGAADSITITGTIRSIRRITRRAAVAQTKLTVTRTLGTFRGKGVVRS
jgi:hypothetical protein